MNVPIVGPVAGILIAWSFTSALFIGIPVIVGLRADARAAAAAGIANAKAVVRRRFFVPSRPRPLHAALLERTVWIERYVHPAHEKRGMRITAVRTSALQFEDGSVFEPRTMSRGFADGHGAAKGVMRGAPALVIFT
jgi:hypothetical protein